MKKLLMSILLLFVLFSTSYGYEVSEANLEEDYTDYVVEKSLWDFALSALPNGDLFGSPDKSKKFGLHEGMSKLRYPVGYPDMYAVYHIYEPDEDCPALASCIRQIKVETIKKKIVSGEDEQGDPSLPIKKYVDNGAQMVQIEYHYIEEESSGEDYEEGFHEYPLKNFEIKNTNEVYQTWVVDDEGSKEDRKVRTCPEIAVLTQNGAGNQCIEKDDDEIIGLNADGSAVYKDSDTDKDVKSTNIIDEILDNAEQNHENDWVEIGKSGCPSGYVGISTQYGAKCTPKSSVDNTQKDEPYDETENDEFSSFTWILLGIFIVSLVGLIFRERIQKFVKGVFK